jgi:hypothetical protein
MKAADQRALAQALRDIGRGLELVGGAARQIADVVERNNFDCVERNDPDVEERRDLAAPQLGTTHPPGEMLLRAEEAAEYLGLSGHMLRKWRAKGYGPPFLKVGTAKASPVAYKQADLDAWLNTREREPTSDAD